MTPSKGPGAGQSSIPRCRKGHRLPTDSRLLDVARRKLVLIAGWRGACARPSRSEGKPAPVRWRLRPRQTVPAPERCCAVSARSWGRVMRD